MKLYGRDKGIFAIEVSYFLLTLWSLRRHKSGVVIDILYLTSCLVLEFFKMLLVYVLSRCGTLVVISEE